ncbi:MAG: ABC transporter permease [Brotaphodocola sp.]
MAKKLIGRLLFSVFVLLMLTFFVFSLSNMMKGNAVDLMMGEEAGAMSEEAYDALLHEMGLDRPIPVRYWDWLTDFVRGDMGTSTLQNRPVSAVLPQRVVPTLVLTFSALLLAVLISIPLGVLSAYKPYSIWDNLASGVAFLGTSMPGFMLCLFFIYVFSVQLKWFPSQGMYYPNQPHTIKNLLEHLLLPASVAGLQMTGNLIKQTRSAVLEVMNEEYIKTARSKGLQEFAVIVKHALRNALIPIITTISLSIPFLVGGAVVIEKIFSWPGMGSLIISSVYSRDFDPLMAAVVVICSVVLLANLALDFLYLLIDPRLSKEK